MKVSKFTMGLVLGSLSINAYAAPGRPVTKPMNEQVRDYIQANKKSPTSGKSGSLDSANQKVAQDKIIESLKMSSSTNNSLAISLRSDPSRANAKLDILSTALAAKERGSELRNANLSKSIELINSANAIIKFTANS